MTFYDALGRSLAVQDPNFGSSQEPGIACSVPLSGKYTACTNYDLGSVSGDSNTYQKVSSIDANNHVTVSYADALGRTVYVSYKSGVNSGTLTTNALKSTQYNALDKPTQVVVTDKAPQSGQSITSVTTSAQYDSLGRLTQVSDPDQGTHNYTYDADGRLFSDVVGTHTLGYNDDLLGRIGCVQDAVPTLNATGACTAGKTYVQNAYDTTELGTQGSTDFPVGHLTQSVATTYYSPDGTSASSTEKFQYDKRGRSITTQLSLSLPSAWNVTTALPTYQQASTYNDADQVTTTTTSTIPSGQGFTTTLAYDSTGAPSGLSNNGTTTPDLATLVYNARAQLDTINFQTSSGGALAAEQFSYDANLRPTGATATWGANSGNSGTLFKQSSSYDNAGNVTSLATTQAAVPGQSGSGGMETSNFCYDEQNRLVWAGNSGTQPGAGNGTCGSGTLASGLSGANYSNSFVYTHLGQLWQGPLAGGSTQYQYLYCNSQPHELTGLYATSATCSNKTGQGYATSYDGFGNVTSRTFSNTTATLSYDNLNHFTEWNAGSTNQEWYVYDAAGNRVLRRFTNSNGTTMIVYAFGVEEHNYSGAGAHQNDTYYYSLGGRLLGALDSNGTTFYLTDTLGSILASFNNAAGGASVKGNQVFAPYGTGRYYKGTINTLKGFTGQYNDGSGLDYYNARYYDPVVGVFLSADSKQGNLQGMNPYAYVNGNPETLTDPTGRYLVGPNGAHAYVVPDNNGGQTLYTFIRPYSGGQFYETIYHFNAQHVIDSVPVTPGASKEVGPPMPSWSGSGSGLGVGETGHPGGISFWYNEDTTTEYPYNYGVGIGVTSDGSQWNLGGSFDGSLFDTHVSGVIGSTDQKWGLTYAIGFKGPEVSAQAGCTTEAGSCGLGGSINPAGSVYASLGVNINGNNVAVTGSAGPALQLSASLGPNKISVSIPFFSLSFTW